MTGADSPARRAFDKIQAVSGFISGAVSGASTPRVVPFDDRDMEELTAPPMELKLLKPNSDTAMQLRTLQSDVTKNGSRSGSGRDGPVEDKNMLTMVDIEGGKSFALVGSFSSPDASDRY